MYHGIRGCSEEMDIYLNLYLVVTNYELLYLFFRNVIKSFYTSSMLMDVLSTFGEGPEDVSIYCLKMTVSYYLVHMEYVYNTLRKLLPSALISS